AQRSGDDRLSRPHRDRQHLRPVRRRDSLDSGRTARRDRDRRHADRVHGMGGLRSRRGRSHVAVRSRDRTGTDRRCTPGAVSAVIMITPARRTATVTILTMAILVSAAPFVLTLLPAFTSPTQFARKGVSWPSPFSLENFLTVLADP